MLNQHGVAVDNLLNPPGERQRQGGGQQHGEEASAGTREGAAEGAGAEGIERERLERVDPEFLAALPPDIREEVLESQRLAEQRREVERRLTQVTEFPTVLDHIWQRKHLQKFRQRESRCTLCMGFGS